MAKEARGRLWCALADNRYLSFGEIKLIMEALQMAAGRHESMARFKPLSAGPHDRKARGMRELRAKLNEGTVED